MYLMLVILLMLFCSTISSYYWSQLDLMQQACTLYLQRQKHDLALKSLRNYGIAWLLENMLYMRGQGTHKLYFKQWPRQGFYRNSNDKTRYQAELVFSCVNSNTGQIRIHALLYSSSSDKKHPTKLDECTCDVF